MNRKETVTMEEADEKIQKNNNEFRCGPINVRMEFTEEGKTMQETLTDFLIKCQKEVVANGQKL